MEMWDANLVQKILRFKRSALDKALGLHVCSGPSIYMLCELEDDLLFEVCLQSTKYKIVVQRSTQCSV